jgi:hypothetical protein
VSDNWIVTASGKKFYFDRPEQAIYIVDIAHALSMICRFGGHVKSRYSVAAHSVHVSRLVPPELALFGLLHDAAEAYVGDVVRPLKELLPSMRPIEKRVERAIYERYISTTPPTEDAVRAIKHADLVALATERRDLVEHEMADDWLIDRLGIVPDPSVTLVGLTPAEDKTAFLARYTELTT